MGLPSFWVDLGERTARSFAQGMIAALGVGAATSAITDLPWITALEVGASSSILCLLMGLAAMKIGDQQTASFLKAPPDQLTRPIVRQARGSSG